MTAPLDEKALAAAEDAAKKSWQGEDMSWSSALAAAIRAYLAASHVNETPKTEHVEADVLPVVAWMHPTAGWARTKYHSVLSHCQKAGPGPVALVRRDPAQSALSAMAAERDEALAKWEKADGMDGAVVDAIRQLLNAQNVPLSAFIDDHVANAIRQRNSAVAQVQRLTEENEAILGDFATTAFELVAAEAHIKALEEALEEFGSSRVRDRVAKVVGCNADILHDALQAEVRAARTTLQKEQADGK